MALLLSMTSNLEGKEPFSFLEMLFTCVSAFATVGFDLGVTEHLSTSGQFILVIGMFVGRLGILLFLTGASMHLFCVLVGINKWYCREGFACKR